MRANSIRTRELDRAAEFFVWVGLIQSAEALNRMEVAQWGQGLTSWTWTLVFLTGLRCWLLLGLRPAAFVLERQCWLSLFSYLQTRTGYSPAAAWLSSLLAHDLGTCTLSFSLKLQACTHTYVLIYTQGCTDFVSLENLH